MLIAVICFFVGVFFAPIIRPLFKPFFIELIKFVMLAIEEAKTTSVRVREEMEDAVATANAEREAKRSNVAKENGDSGSDIA